RLLYAPLREKNEGIPGLVFVRGPLFVVGLPGTVARSQEPAVSEDQKLFPFRPLTTDDCLKSARQSNNRSRSRAHGHERSPPCVWAALISRMYDKVRRRALPSPRSWALDLLLLDKVDQPGLLDPRQTRRRLLGPPYIPTRRALPWRIASA